MVRANPHDIRYSFPRRRLLLLASLAIQKKNQNSVPAISTNHSQYEVPRCFILPTLPYPITNPRLLFNLKSAPIPIVFFV